MRMMQAAIFQRTQMETTMQQTILTALVISLFAATAAQAKTASEHRHARTKERAAVFEKFRSSNAYAAPRDIAVQPDWSNYANGAMTSGLAGH
jgi:hypothetical protein